MPNRLLRSDAKQDITWPVAMRPVKRKAPDKDNNLGEVLIDQVEKIKAGIRAKVEHLFRVVKRQFRFARVRPTTGQGLQCDENAPSRA